MDNIEVICLGAAIVDIPLQPVSKNIFDVDSYPLERIAMTTGGDAINGGHYYFPTRSPNSIN